MKRIWRAALLSSTTFGFALLVLCGCPSSIGFQILSKTPPKTPFTHAPNAKDLESWNGMPQAQLESHAHFAPLPRETSKLDDGSETWTFRSCPPESKDRADCCIYEFVVRDTTVASCRTAGPCAVDCSMRPESKVQACIDAAKVPEHYGTGSH